MGGYSEEPFFYPRGLKQSVRVCRVPIAVLPAFLPIETLPTIRIFIATDILVIWMDIPCPRKKHDGLDLSLALFGYDILK